METRAFSSPNYQLLAVSFAILIFVLALTTDGYANEEKGISEDAIKIGIITDMTGPAVHSMSAFGNGTRNYFRWLNEQGGINGRKVKVILEDDRYSIPMAIAAFKKLVYLDKIFAIVGLSGTGQSRSLFPQVEKEKIPVTSYSAAAISPPFRRYVFAISASYKDMVYTAFDYIFKVLKVKNPRIAFIYPDNEYGKVGIEAARDRAKFYGIKMVTEEIVNFGVLDVTSQLLSLKRARADFIMIHTEITSGLSLIKGAKMFGMNPNYTYIYTGDDEIMKKVGNAGENLTMSTNVSGWYEAFPAMKSLKEFTLKVMPNMGVGSRPYVYGWTAGLVFAEGMKRTGKDLTREGLIDTMEKFRNLDTQGLCGPVTYTPTDHQGARYSRIFRTDVNSGVYIPVVPVTEWLKPVE